MNDAFDQAKSRRNALERLGEKIPGFRGFQDRELRRDVDKRLRDDLAGRLAAIRDAARRRAGDYADAGRIGDLTGFDRLDKRLDGLSQAVRFADYGVSGFFDAVKIDEAALARLYEFDLELVDELTVLEGTVAAIPAPGPEGPETALAAALAALDRTRTRWSERERVVAGAAGTGHSV